MNPKATGRYITTAVAGETVNAFLPAPLPPILAKEELAELEEPLRKAEAAIDRLRLAGEMIPSLDWFVYSFVRKEALLSSEIEGTQATLADVLSYEQTGKSGLSNIADVEEVANYVKAINFALEAIESDRGLPVSVRLLDECHRRLMQGVRGESKLPGEMRRSQVWIGGTRPSNAAFVPPPADQLKDLLGDLETYIHKDKTHPPILRAAAAHVQFETIHPYLDGNGRLGRMLISILLSHWKVLPDPLLYLSVYLKEHQSHYYQKLDRVRTDGDWVGWFSFFLEGIQQVAIEAADTAGQLHVLVSRDRRRLLELESITVSALQLFELLPRNPVVSMPLVKKHLKTTKPTAGKAIDLLQAAGILAELGERKRDRTYIYESYVRKLTLG